MLTSQFWKFLTEACTLKKEDMKSHCHGKNIMQPYLLIEFKKTERAILLTLLKSCNSQRIQCNHTRLDPKGQSTSYGQL